MKKIMILAGLFLFSSTFAFAITNVWTSSHTLTAETTKNLCMQTGNGVTIGQAIFHGVCVSSATASAGANIIIYASSGTAVNPIANIDQVNRGCYYYDVYSSTSPGGLTYTTSQPGASTTIMYECY